MAESRFERVQELFAAALELAAGERREAFLAARCEGDPELLAELRSLVASHERTTGVLDHPPAVGEVPAAGGLGPGAELGPWRLVRLIGEGGSGEVYLAERADGAFEQRVAVKLLRQEAVAQLDRFHAERQILARLEHPGIARLLDGGVAGDGRPYAVLELVEGHTLTEHCRRRRAGREERLRLFCQVCEIVAHAHRHLVVHRDLKPGNILVGADGRPRLLDFGIAKLLDAAGSAGDEARTRAPLTLEYAAPEQLTGDAVTTATDVYALGVVLFELLAGARPWRTAELPVARIVRQLLEQTPPRPSQRANEPGAPVPARLLRGDLDAIVGKCLRKEPSARYESVDALRQDVERHLAHRPVRAREGARLYVLGRLLRRHRLAAAGIAAVALSLAAGLAGFAWQARRVAIERDVARRAASREEAVRDHLIGMFRTSLAEGGSTSLTAKEMLDRSARRLLDRYGDDPQLAGEVVETLADLYGALGDLEGQAPLLESFLAAAGPEADPAAVALARQKLANIALVKGDPGRAGELLAAAEAFWSTAPERYREQRLEGMFVRGQLLRAQGDLDGSAAAYEEAIRERVALSGRAHREVANLYNSLAITLTAGNRIEEALAAYREALAVNRELGREDDLEALVMLANTGSLAFRHGRLREAEVILAEAMRRQRAVAGESAALAAAMGLHGAALTALGRGAEAVPLLTEAVAIAERLSGPTSPLTVQDRIFLGEAQVATGELLAARRAHEETAVIARQQYGEGHLYVRRIELALAHLELLEGRPSLALARLEALLPALRALGGPQAAWLAHAQVQQGEALLALGRAEAATAPLREAVELRENLLWSGSWELAQARTRLAEALLAGGDRAGAAALLEPALAALRAELGPEHAETRRAATLRSHLAPSPDDDEASASIHRD